MKSSQETKKKEPKICWNRASIEEKEDYKKRLVEKLKSIHHPNSLYTCRDTNCKDGHHLQSCDEYLMDILESIKEAAMESLPSSKLKTNRKKPLIMNWKEEIAPFRDKALFWSSVWMSAGKPKTMKCIR